MSINSMFKENRQQKIMIQLEKDGRVVTTDLADEFKVSAMTIRRDLREIEARGYAQCTHGGAILLIKAKSHAEPPTLERMDSLREEKQAIAKEVVGLIGQREMIFLGSGTTTLFVAIELSNRDDITVVTNSLLILNHLSSSAKMAVIGVGGFLRRRESSLIGHFADNVIQNLRVDKVIMGMRGIHPRFGLTSEDPQELMTDRAILGISDTVIIVADHTKIGHVSTSRTAPITVAKKIITTEKAPPEMIAAIREQGVDVDLVHM